MGQRELARFEADPSSDHVFNFFITIYHVRDWVKVEGISVDELDNDPDFELCRLACNHGKHFQLTKEITCRKAADRQYAPHADVAFSGTQEFAIQADGIRIDIVSLGHRVLSKLSKLLNEFKH